MIVRLVIAVFFLAGLGDVSLAKRCGDDVDGVDVPCSCGDVVVSDLVLGDDPVASQVCPGTGLVVDASGTSPLTIDLAGRTLRGSGEEYGLLVKYGGVGGASVTSGTGRATIEHFALGVSASADDGVGLLEKVTVRDTQRDGVRLRGKGVVVRQAEVVRAGRDGFVFSGRDYVAEGNRSTSSGRHGFMLLGHSGTLSEHNEAVHSGGVGFMVAGGGHSLVDCNAAGGMKDGFEVVASDLTITRCTAENNRGSGIGGHGARWKLEANRASGNGGDGIRVRGGRLADLGGNRGWNNGGSSGADAVQCAIAGVACAEAAAP